MSDELADATAVPDPATYGAVPDPVASAQAPPPSRAGRSDTWPMWVLGFVVLTDQIDQSILRGVLEQLRAEFGLSDPQLGLLASCFILVNGLITIPAGYLADRWNRTRTVGHTMLVWSGITAVTAAAPNYGFLVAVRSALGFGQAITEPSANSLVADYYPLEERGRAFSIQQVMGMVGMGIGLGLGGLVGATLGWRWAFLIVGSPSIVVAFMVYRLREPRRGAADRRHAGVAHADEDDDGLGPNLLDEGLKVFFTEMARGLVADMKTISRIRTMRYALVGVGVLLFTVTGISVWLPSFYERQLGVAGGSAQLLVGSLLILGGIPGVLYGGRIADRYVTRIQGGRMAIPALCIFVGNLFFMVSYARLPVLPTYLLQLLGIFVLTMSIPALRAGLSDAVPANLRGAGFGAFNLASVLFGQAAAPLVVSFLSNAYDDNLRTAFIIVSFPVFLGAALLFSARKHLEEDTAKIFEAVLTAMQEQQQREEELRRSHTDER
jgi:MFS family permease